MSPAEDSPSGLGRTLGKRVGGNPSRVRISYPPPLLSPGNTSKAPAARCGGLRRRMRTALLLARQARGVGPLPGPRTFRSGIAEPGAASDLWSLGRRCTRRSGSAPRSAGHGCGDGVRRRHGPVRSDVPRRGPGPGDRRPAREGPRRAHGRGPGRIPAGPRRRGRERGGGQHRSRPVRRSAPRRERTRVLASAPPAAAARSGQGDEPPPPHGRADATGVRPGGRGSRWWPSPPP